MTVVAPEDESWAVADSDGATVRTHGPRDVWAELEEVHARWVRAGRPSLYRVEIPAADGPQHVTSGTGPDALTWTLPAGSGTPQPRRSPSTPDVKEAL